MRILIAGLVGGIAMFFWSFVAHDLTQLGMVGVNTLPDESVTVSNLSSAIGDKSGLYLFPLNMGGGAAAPSAAGPGGFLVYNAHSPLAMTPRNLIVEFLTELVESLIATWLLAQTALLGYVTRVGFVTVVGIVAAITTNIPYWNWYSFPANYTLAYGFIEVIAYLAAGLVIAAVLRPNAATAPA